MEYSEKRLARLSMNDSSIYLKPKEQPRVYENENIMTLQSKLMRTMELYDDLYAKYLELEGQNKFNHLTGLYTIEHFGAVIKTLKKKGEFGTVLVLDICDFRIINREFSYEFGNRVLALVGERLSQRIDYETMFGYFGCNRIAVHRKSKMNYEQAQKLFTLLRNDICDVLNEYYPLNVRGVVIPTGREITDVNGIYMKSEVLLKRIKEKNLDFIFYDSNYQQIEASKEELTRYILSSVKNRNYFIVYQEKVDSRTNKVVGLEALARLRKDDRVISPNAFIPVLEESDFIVQFGKELIRTVFEDMEGIGEKYGDDAVVSINISPKHFKYDELDNLLVNLSKKHGISLKRIELEITENVFVNDIDSCMRQLKSLQNKGVKFAIDDFGTGYSSLQYLTKLPVDTLKIDKS